MGTPPSMRETTMMRAARGGEKKARYMHRGVVESGAPEGEHGGGLVLRLKTETETRRDKKRRERRTCYRANPHAGRKRKAEVAYARYLRASCPRCKQGVSARRKEGDKRKRGREGQGSLSRAQRTQCTQTHLYVSRLPSSRSMYSRSSIASIPFLTSGTRGWNRALSWSTVSAINCWCFIVLRDFMILYVCVRPGSRHLVSYAPLSGQKS